MVDSLCNLLYLVSLHLVKFSIYTQGTLSEDRETASYFFLQHLFLLNSIVYCTPNTRMG